MQSFVSLSRAVYRIVFRSGSPQRVMYSNQLMVIAGLSFALLGIASQYYLFHSGPLEIGLFLFTCLAGLYIAAALLTRKVPRSRLRVSLLAALLIMAASQALLLLLAPLADYLSWLRYGATALIGAAVLLGACNCLQFALGKSRSMAATYTVLFAVAITAFYGTMYPLIQIVFA